MNSIIQHTYKTKVKARLINEINSIRNKYQIPHNELVLVLDVDTAFKLSNLFTMSELVENGITFIERLQLKRKKLDKHALYFIQPIKTNVQHLLMDFAQNPQYKKIHILFTTFIQKSLLKEIAHNKLLLKKIAKNSIKQFYHSCVLIAENTLSAQLPYLSFAFSEDSQGEQNMRNVLANKFMEVIVNMEKINKVRIYYKKSQNKVCQRMAHSLQQSINRYLGILLQNKSINVHKNAQDIVLLVIDRSVDTVSPLIHHFSYQCLLFDLFDVKFKGIKDLEDKGDYSYEEIQNQVYQNYRYQHISQALEKLPLELQNMKNGVESIKVKDDLGSLNIKEMNNQLAQLRSNIDMLDAVWKQFKINNIQQLADLEQSLTTGLTSDGANTSSMKLLSQVTSLIKSHETSRMIKLRLALVCLSCIKFSKSDYVELLDLFSREDKQILRNIIALGVSYSGQVNKSTKTITKEQQLLAKKRMENTGMPLNRHTTILELVVPLFCQILSQPKNKSKIDSDIFGYLQCQIFKQENQQKQFVLSFERMALCMVGGLSWTEISSLRNISSLKNITIITDSILTPNQFVKEVGNIRQSILTI